MSGDGGRRLLLHMSVSLDGFAAHRDHSLDWLTPAVYADGSSGQVLRPLADGRPG